MNQMHEYAVFGGRLRSELPFPELTSGPAAGPSWTLRVAARGTPVPEPSPAEFLGEDGIIGPVRARLYGAPDGGYLLVYTHWNVGAFKISADGSEILWLPEPEPIVEAARLCILGRVLATAMHAAGTLCLHGSAVALSEGAVAFLAPKFHGKSTLATALVRAGARLATDDVLPVEFTEPIRIRAGVHRLRLWKDSAEHLSAGAMTPDSAGAAKVYLDGLPLTRLMSEPEPLLGLYILSPVLSEPIGRPAVVRHQVDSISAVMALLRNASLGTLLERGGAPLLERVTSLADRVPVYSLEVVRDLARLPEVVATLREWHDGALTSALGSAR